MPKRVQGPEKAKQAAKGKKQGPASGGERRLKVTLVKSTIGFDEKQDRVVIGMGLRRLGHTVELPDTPATRGMILKVRHLVTVE
jgi:large subunit ribosomal protein L30